MANNYTTDSAWCCQTVMQVALQADMICSASADRQERLLEAASREAGLQHPLLAPTVKAQQLIRPAHAVPLTLAPEVCLCLHAGHVCD